MPFTISHVAAILPFAGKRLPLSALAVGAMAPDFEYLLRLKALTSVSHTAAGIFTFCIPSGLFALWLYHSVLKQPMATLLPDELQGKLQPYLARFSLLPLRRLLIVSLCIAFGAATHIVWDGCTHKTGFIVQHCPALQQTTFDTPYGAPHVYRILQHASTAIGLAVLLLAFGFWYSRAPSLHQIEVERLPVRLRSRVAATLVITAALLAFTFTAARSGLPNDFDSLRRYLVLTAIAGLDSSILLATIYAIGRREIETALLARFQ